MDTSLDSKELQIWIGEISEILRSADIDPAKRDNLLAYAGKVWVHVVDYQGRVRGAEHMVQEMQSGFIAGGREDMPGKLFVAWLETILLMLRDVPEEFMKRGR